MREDYPFEEDWPIEGFALNKDTGKFVQIRIAQCASAIPPYRGYPSAEHKGSYVWWEVRLCFRPYTPKSDPKSPYIEIKGKSGHLLPEKNAYRCIARFATKEEAYAFTHKLHQSKKKSNFFVDFPQ